MLKKNKGFTLSEVLVVILIIAFFVGLVSFVTILFKMAFL